MADVDLTGDIALAVNGAALRGATLVIGYIADNGAPALSYRGSALVYGPQQLAVWARNPDDGLAKAMADRPLVSLIYFSRDSPGPRYLYFRGRGHVDADARDRVYEEMIEGERNGDPEKNGVAIVIDIDRVDGFAEDGRFTQERDA